MAAINIRIIPATPINMPSWITFDRMEVSFANATWTRMEEVILDFFAALVADISDGGYLAGCLLSCHSAFT